MAKIKKSTEFLGDLINCEFDLTKILYFRRQIKNILEKYNIKVLNTSYYVFEPTKGFTLIFILSGSHLAIHTWPEKQLANVDFYLCDLKKPKRPLIRKAFKEIIKLFLAQKVITKEIVRYT